MVIVISKEKHLPGNFMRQGKTVCIHTTVFSVKPSWKCLRLDVFGDFCTANWHVWFVFPAKKLLYHQAFLLFSAKGDCITLTCGRSQRYHGVGAAWDYFIWFWLCSCCLVHRCWWLGWLNFSVVWRPLDFSCLDNWGYMCLLVAFSSS